MNHYNYVNKFILVVIVVLLHVNNANSEDTQQFPPRHILVTPSRLLAATPNRICLSRLGPTTQGAATTQIDLLTLGGQSHNSNRNSSNLRSRYLARVRKVYPEGNGGCVDLLVPRTPHRKVLLQFRMRLDSLPDYKIVERRELYIQHDTSMQVIQTDKPLYRAGETVKFRVLQMKPDLTPLQLPVYRVSIETPPDLFGGPVKVVQWFNVSTQLGLIQREYQIDKYAMKGEWRIVVDSREPWVGSTIQPFTVTDYTLPKFHITVNHDEDILSTLQYYSYNICAKYTYGEFVSGRLLVTVTSDSYESRNLHHETRLDSGRGCYNYTLETRSLGFGTSDVPKVVIAHIALQEDSTRFWRNTTVVSQVTSNVVKIHYVTRQYTQYKTWLPYKMIVKVTDWKHRPVADAKVQFCKLLNDQTEEVDNQHEQESSQVLYEAPKDTGNVTRQRMLDNLIDECDTNTTDDKGYTSYLFVMDDDDNVQHVRLKAIVIDHPLNTLEPVDRRFPSATLTLNSFGNSSKDTIEIGHPTPGSGDLRIGSRQHFPIYMTTWDEKKITPMTVHYVFITRSGNIFRWGTTIQCPIQITLPDAENAQSVFATYDTTVYSNGTEECPGRTQYTSPSGLYKMTVPVRISHVMCPSSSVIVYYMTSSGEIVVASRQFKVHECFYNKVHMQWSPAQVNPSAATTLHLRTPVPSPSLCLLSATSTAFRHLTTQSSSQPQQMQSRVIYALNTLMERRQNRTIYTMKRNLCFDDDSQPVNATSHDHYDKILRIFLSAGVEILTDTIPNRAECPKVEEMIEKPSELYIPDNEYTKDRTYFPETWLWDLHVLDSKGRLDVSVTVPDEITQWDCQVYCLSRFGLAVSSNRDSGVLKVIQPFFVDLVVPKVAKRGEDVQMFYKIFNYMDYDVPVSVSLDVTPSAAASITSHQTGDRMSCLRKGQSLVSHFTVRGHQLRSVNVTVGVQVVNNGLPKCGGNSAIHNIKDRVVKEVTIEPEGYVMENHKSALLCVDDINNKTEYSWYMDRVKCSQQSENWFISVVGDITGPMYLNVESLLSIPMGCGEQNMALLAYNLIALEYALTGKRVASDVKEKAVQNLATGYQRQLRFRHPSGGFSAFGASDHSASTWLTAFCVAYLPSVADRVETAGRGHLETKLLDEAVEWLLEQQMENGCFRKEGQVFHREMKGGLMSETSSIALTAFVIISLIDSKSTLLKPSVVQNTQYCLAALKYYHTNQKRHGTTININQDRIYTLSLATLAQIKIDEYFKKLESKNDVLAEKRSLFKRGINFDFYDQSLEIGERNDFTEFLDDFDGNAYNNYFNLDRRFSDDLARDAGIVESVIAEPLLVAEKRKGEITKDFLAGGGANALSLLKTFAQRAGDMLWWEADSLSVSIETTGYAMLSMLSLGGDENILDSMAAARWLSMHRSRKGGFISTQDTLIGIRAICLLRHSLPGMPPSLSVSVRAPGRGRKLEIGPAERHKLHTVVVRAVDTILNHGDAKLTVAVQGRGCVLVQVTQRYNSVSGATETSPFRLLAKVTTDGTFSCKDNNTSCMCAAVLEVCVTWISPSSFPEMAMLEVHLPTGYFADRSLLYQLITKDNILLRRVEESRRGDKLFLYLSSELQGNPGGLSECLPLYLVGPQAYTLPATVRVYDYYHSDVSYAVNYSIPQACEFNRARRPHEEPMDLANENGEHQDDNVLAAATASDDSNFEITDSTIDWDKIDFDKQDLHASFVSDKNNLERIDSLPNAASNVQSDESAKKGIQRDERSTESVVLIDSSAPTTEVTKLKDTVSPVESPWDVDRNRPAATTESSMNEMFTKNWHVIDSEHDLDTPKTVEGVPPVYVLPPPSFNYSKSFRFFNPRFGFYNI